MISTLFKLAWVFLKIGTFSFGGGIVIIPMIENEVVANYGWLTKTEFIDAVTWGQITPGPIIVSGTFIGYKACGILGAIVATVSVILPSFIMICLVTEAIKKFRENKILANFLREANAEATSHLQQRTSPILLLVIKGDNNMSTGSVNFCFLAI